MKQSRKTQMAFIVLVVIMISATAFGQGKTPRIPKGHDFTKIAPGARYKSGELLVRFAPNPDGTQRGNAQTKQILRSLDNADLKRGFKLVPGLSVVKLPEGQTVEDALKTFNVTDGILYAEPNYEVEVVSTFPNDTYFDDLWGMHNTGQTGGTEDADIDAPEAWDVLTGSSDIIVAVIDTGVDYNHVDLAANMWVNPVEEPNDANGDGRPGVKDVDDDGDGLIDEDSADREPGDPGYTNDLVNDDDENGYNDDIHGYDFCTYGGKERDSDPMDDHYHGTHCAGTIGAIGNNNEGVVGVCWNVRIMALKFLSSSGPGWGSDAILCVQYATMMGADVMSNSWGGGGYSQSLKDAIEAAGANDVLFVAAAGNYNSDNDTFPHYPSSYDCNNIVAVMATKHNDAKSSFSNYGATTVDLGAPGSSILSCKLGGGYWSKSGTSMACPHVAGACALLWSKSPDLTAQGVKDILLDYVDKVESLEGLCVAEGRLNVSNMILREIVHNLDSGKWYNTIQGAIDDANDFDTVLVYPGTYYETVNFNGLPITLRSTNPYDWDVVAATIIDANSSGDVVTFDSSEDANSVITGLTITGSSSSYSKAGIKCSGASPTVTWCIIEDNSQGIYCTSGSPTITYNKIGENSRSGTASSSSTPPNITNNWIYDNDLYGIFFTNATSAATVRNNTVVANSGKGIHVSLGTAPTITNCIVWGSVDDLSNCSATYSCIEDPNDAAGTGNISSDPLFIDPNNYDYHLSFSSPCINAGDPNYEPDDAETDIDHQPRIIDGRVDMGADEVGRVHNITQDTWYLNIQPAIDDANDYDELVAYPYTYYETVDFNGLPITLRSYDPNDWYVVAETIIDANDPTSGKAVEFSTGEDANSVLEGFTLTGGDYGVYCYGSYPYPIIRKCVIEYNTTYGVYCRSASPEVSHNKIHDNGTYGILIGFSPSAPLIKNNWIYDQTYGIVSAYTTSVATVRNNTIVGNTAGGIWVASGTEPNISNCILWNENADDLDGCSATYSCIEDGDGVSDPNNHNIDDDPLFVDPNNDDYHIKVTSPCVDAGNSSGIDPNETDIDGEPRRMDLDGQVRPTSIVDMGADEVAGRVYNITQDKWYSHIQLAINDANDADTLEANEDTYTENVNFKGRSITLRSTDPNDWAVVAETIIDASGGSYAVLFGSSEDANSVITGFTVTNAEGLNTGGIYCNGGSPTITKCIIEDNSHGVYCADGSPTIENNMIQGNRWSGILSASSAPPTIKNNWIYHNDGYGVFCANASSAGTISNNTIADNPGNPGKGIYVSSGTAPTISNCILWDNVDDLSGCTATYSCIKDCNDVGEGNICDDPLFVDPNDPNDPDYHLDPNSPCIDVGDPSGDYTGEYDIDGDDRVIDIPGKGDGTVDVDMGSDEYKP